LTYNIEVKCTPTGCVPHSTLAFPAVSPAAGIKSSAAVYEGCPGPAGATARGALARAPPLLSLAPVAAASKCCHAQRKAERGAERPAQPRHATPSVAWSLHHLYPIPYTLNRGQVPCRYTTVSALADTPRSRTRVLLSSRFLSSTLLSASRRMLQGSRTAYPSTESGRAYAPACATSQASSAPFSRTIGWLGRRSRRSQELLERHERHGLDTWRPALG
jgi:hypothetical protein